MDEKRLYMEDDMGSEQWFLHAGHTEEGRIDTTKRCSTPSTSSSNGLSRQTILYDALCEENASYSYVRFCGCVVQRKSAGQRQISAQSRGHAGPLHIRLLEHGTTDKTSAAGSNETSLLTSRSATSNGGGVTNVLVVTTTVRVVDGVHGNTTSLGP